MIYLIGSRQKKTAKKVYQKKDLKKIKKSVDKKLTKWYSIKRVNEKKTQREKRLMIFEN